MKHSAAQKHTRYNTETPVLVISASGLNQSKLMNVSLGGAFVSTERPPTLGDTVQLRVDADGLVVDAKARVVHVRDKETATQTELTPGAGIEFQDLSLESMANLHHFIDGLTREITPQGAGLPRIRQEPRLSSALTAIMQLPDGTRLQLPLQNVSKGGAYLITPQPPATGTVVHLELPVPTASLVLKAQVVHSARNAAAGMPPGAGLQFMGLTDEQRSNLASFLEDQVVKTVEPSGKTPTLEEVMEAVSRLLGCLEKQDGVGALGLPHNTSEAKVKERVAQLRQLFAAPPQRATPAQAARIVAAARLLPKLERTLLAMLTESHHSPPKK
jgi:Tfp pilus assembly protein PilZ